LPSKCLLVEAVLFSDVCFSECGQGPALRATIPDAQRLRVARQAVSCGLDVVGGNRKRFEVSVEYDVSAPAVGANGAVVTS